VTGKDNRAAGANHQSGPCVYARTFKSIQFSDECVGRNHHTIADQATDLGPQNTRGNQVEHSLLAINNQGMPRIMTALKSYYGLAAFGQKVNDLSFAFVSPLDSQYNDTACHLTTSCFV
jgi:hypothetical protein